jgi:hypothetical protein
VGKVRESEHAMRSIAIFSRLLLVAALLVSSLTPLSALAGPLTRDALRARKLAARRYEGGTVALPDAAVANGLQVCAKETPSGILGYFKVTPRVMALVDTALMAHLRKSKISAQLPFSPKLYLRQYVGYVREGARFVYVNAVLVERGSAAAAAARKAFPRSCTAVSGSWGIQYDVKAKKFMAFSPK